VDGGASGYACHVPPDLLVLLVSLLAGAFGSMVGIGGGLIVVPVLTTVLGYDITVVVPASLLGVIAVSVGAAGPFLDAGTVDRPLAIRLLIATAAGGLTGGLIAASLDARMLAALFALLLVYVALQMARGVRPRAAGTGADDPARHARSYVEPVTKRRIGYTPRRLPAGGAASWVAGNVSGLLGVGGGVINVPVMTLLMDVPMRVATTTSTFMLGATAAASAIVYEAHGRLDPMLAAPVVLGVFAGAKVGARLSKRIPPAWLRVAFVALAAWFAVQMTLKAIG